MKKLFIGLTLLMSLSSFASEIKCVSEQQSLNKLTKVPTEDINQRVNELEEQGHDVTVGKITLSETIMPETQYQNGNTRTIAHKVVRVCAALNY